MLANPPRGGHSHWRDALKLVQSRIQRWKQGDLLGLWSEASTSTNGLRARSKAKTTSTKSLRRSNATHARRAVEEGQYKKALQALTSMGHAQLSSEVYNQMIAKHPQSDSPDIAPPPPVHVFTRRWLMASDHFPTCSAVGPSSLHANHLERSRFPLFSSPCVPYTTIPYWSGQPPLCL